jgi:hypothetical protein
MQAMPLDLFAVWLEEACVVAKAKIPRGFLA